MSFRVVGYIFLWIILGRGYLLGQQKQPISLFDDCCGHYAVLKSQSSQGTRPDTDTIRFPFQQFSSQLFDYITYTEAYKPINFDSVYCPPPPANSSAQTIAELQQLKTWLDTLRNQSLASRTDLATFRQIARVGVWLKEPRTTDSGRIFSVVPALLFIPRTYLRTSLDTILFTSVRTSSTEQQAIAAYQNLLTEHPATFRWLASLVREATAYSIGWKKQYMRPRPYQLDTTLRTLERPGHASYPSNHAIMGFLLAKAWHSLVGDSAQPFLKKEADNFAFSREIAGVHYPSDTEASRSIVEQLWAYWQTSAEFIRDQYSARKEWQRLGADHKEQQQHK